MTERKWTKGPWVPVKGAGWIVTRPDAQSRRESALAAGIRPDSSLVESPGWPTNDEEARANAYLMAGAPDLYDALEVVRDADEDCKRDGLPTMPPLARAKIDAALSRATKGTGDDGPPQAEESK